MIAQLAQQTSRGWVLTPLLLIVVIVVVAVLLAWRGRLRSVPRRPRRRHLVTRIVCAALGLAIVIAVGVSTWRDVEAIYMVPGGSPNVPVPTLAPPLVPEMPKDARTLTIPEARFLVHWVFLDSGMLPLRVESFDVRWKGRRVEFRRQFTVEGYDISIAFSVDDVAWQRGWDDSNRAELSSEGNVRFECRGPSSGMSSLGDGSPLTTRYFDEMGWPGAIGYNPLSVVHPVREMLHVIRFVERVAPDDPLKEVTAEEFGRTRAESLAACVNERHSYSIHTVSGVRESVPGVAMLVCFGPVCLLLLVAAVLFAQLFIHRPLAFAGMLTLMVLYGAVLDRAVLQAHVSRLSDTGLPVTSRILAARNARLTFFYAKTAEEKLDAVIGDENEPEVLREALKRLRADMPAWTDTGGRDAPAALPFPSPKTITPTVSE